MKAREISGLIEKIEMSGTNRKKMLEYLVEYIKNNPMVKHLENEDMEMIKKMAKRCEKDKSKPDSINRRNKWIQIIL